jgi:uncharacterized protein (DUF433 family)
MQTLPSAVQPRIVCDPEIVGGAPNLSADDIKAAIRFYAEHRAEIDAELLAEELASD